MSVISYAAFITARVLIFLMRLSGRNATTLPGVIAYRMDKGIAGFLSGGYKVIIVTGTNGKTTTSGILSGIYRSNGYKVINNVSGANLISGIITSMAESLNFSDLKKGKTAKAEGKFVEKSVIILEMDEAAFAGYSKPLEPSVILVTNLFRDQLDRYGELSNIRDLIRKGIALSPRARVVLCGDDSLSASLKKNIENETLFFGVSQTSMKKGEPGIKNNPEAANCIFCGTKYDYTARVFGHLGRYSCPGCGYKRPDPDFEVSYRHIENNRYSAVMKILSGSKKEEIEVLLSIPGEHNVYNATAAFSAAVISGIPADKCREGIINAAGGFGRMERFLAGGKEICIILIKNPAGLDRALDFLENASDIGSLMFLLNDNYADGTDVSWIWDVEFENRNLNDIIYVSGSRCYDMALRIKYSREEKIKIEASYDYKLLFRKALSDCPEKKCFYILPNYTSMLDLRKHLEKKYRLKGIWE